MSIRTLASLQRHLQWALELEHATIPAYLCALYSIAEGANVAAQQQLRAVVMEEMLHMVLVANVLNAVGGCPKVDDPAFVPSYPTTLPHSDGSVCVQLRRFDREALQTFLKIERPEPPQAKPEPERYHSIGQFYDAIEAGLRQLAGELGPALFSGSVLRQVDPTRWYYGGGGRPIVVSDLASALAALDEIKAQGEGLPHSVFDDHAPFGQRELAHYFRFEQLRQGRFYRPEDSPRSGPSGDPLPLRWDQVHPMRANPRMADYAGQPEVHALMRRFNLDYTALLRALHGAFNGQPALLFEAVPMMYRLKYQAQALMQLPCGDASGETVGPSFEYCV
ncbi:ferritin-like domain-containing protein [Pseudorhodoferax sp.]|uniref:ferritin-like domain-containing protein n=1 Tax=Pseudorhodoferax sp. TaxID=1993553 RepID=UPI002DD6A08F|nr:ferritin-like protein [Pseudorhodoferax sp.]